MSAEKRLADNTNDKILSAKRPCSSNDDIAGVTRDICQLIRFYQGQGIRYYPKSKTLSGFLAEEYLYPGSPRRTEAIRQKTVHAASALVPPTKEQLRTINEQIAKCKLCCLADNRIGIVTGRGLGRERLMIVGDWSQQNNNLAGAALMGAEEDIMLAKMAAAINLDLDTIYVTNSIKCCPTNKCRPNNASARFCLSHLKREIGLIRPEIILAMGEIPTRMLINSPEPLFRLRGRFHRYRHYAEKPIRVMPTFHPRFLLRHQEMKRASWLDLQAVQQALLKK